MSTPYLRRLTSVPHYAGRLTHLRQPTAIIYANFRTLRITLSLQVRAPLPGRPFTCLSVYLLARSLCAFFAAAIMSLMRLSWLASDAPGS